VISDVTKERHAKRNGTIWFTDLNVAQNGKFGLMFRQNLANIWNDICVSTNKQTNMPTYIRVSQLA